jgi:hypothetical protein
MEKLTLHVVQEKKINLAWGARKKIGDTKK